MMAFVTVATAVVVPVPVPVPVPVVAAATVAAVVPVIAAVTIVVVAGLRLLSVLIACVRSSLNSIGLRRVTVTIAFMSLIVVLSIIEGSGNTAAFIDPSDVVDRAIEVNGVDEPSLPSNDIEDFFSSAIVYNEDDCVDILSSSISPVARADIAVACGYFSKFLSKCI